MKKIPLILFVLLFLIPESKAQPLAAYTDIQRNFMVHDNGMNRKVEHLMPMEYKVGKIAIPYIDNAKNFKIYSNGSSVKINDGFTNRFYATDNLVAYYNANALWVWENDETQLLSGLAERAQIGDSVVLYFDGVHKAFKAYYAGQIYNIEDYLGASNRLSYDGNITENMSIGAGQLPSSKVGSNIAAYVDYTEQFKCFMYGEIITLESYLIQSFDVARNIVAYVDGDSYFKVYYNGTIEELEPFPPKSYAAGNGMVAYIDHAGYFKIFYEGELIEIEYSDVDFKINENVIAFSNSSGQFLAFYKGRFKTLENFTPNSVKIGYNSIAFMGAGQALKLFTKGEIYDISRGDISQWSLDYDVLTYQFGRNLMKVFYDGDTY